jgi:hypothetical protein
MLKANKNVVCKKSYSKLNTNKIWTKSISKKLQYICLFIVKFFSEIEKLDFTKKKYYKKSEAGENV